MAGRTLISKLSPLLATRIPVLRLRPLVAASSILLRSSAASVASLRSFSSRPTTSLSHDSSPNWSNRPRRETILLDGCDFEHWLVVLEPPEPSATRDEIIDSYIKTLAQVVGSEEEARMKIYSVSTKHYFAFGALVSEELSYKIKALPKVRWVLPDSYLDVKNKDYGGEPFINGEAVPYDPKYHEEWVRNNARANERSRRNDRPRNFDRSRNFERRRENMQNRPMQNQDFQGRSNPPPPPAQQNAAAFNQMPNNNAPSQPPPNMGYQNQMPNSNVPPSQPPPPNGGYQNQMPNSNAPPSQPPPPSGGYQNQMPNPGYQGGAPVYQGQAPPAYQNQQGYQGGSPGYQGGAPGYQGGNSGYQGGRPAYQGGSPPYQGGDSGYQGHQGGNMPNYQSTPYPGGNSSNYQGGGGPAYQVRDEPVRD
ncbi:LOW QUALITY PROTEIN: multiple organellar RNA editing factor 8, chloroplastic/mitochondrial-like [Asparagus officinalis]|uniref:LOW QUALITY PROTEIN: multiple organellar RNA editing factor 8, chloroplastic/mitochondrial-like n=1 Tax=Asparagus officinalis TaxID=4686 RepID=UPI00098DFCE9|nr:LOW QUALITY PROTEIN: multiple organellar RNA editing factor 8, chloroplastic/mitochondrial-like [Asparagus officinalis]